MPFKKFLVKWLELTQSLAIGQLPNQWTLAFRAIKDTAVRYDLNPIISGVIMLLALYQSKLGPGQHGKCRPNPRLIVARQFQDH
jgi:hypothetical protein